jgi:hypothetical protein
MKEKDLYLIMGSHLIFLKLHLVKSMETVNLSLSAQGESPAVMTLGK